MFEECSLFGQDYSDQQGDIFSMYKSQDKSVEWDDYQVKETKFIQYCQKDPHVTYDLGVWNEYLQPQVCQQLFQNQKSSSSKSQDKNETKNIPKNFGKATILYILNNKKRSRKLLIDMELKEKEFKQFVLYSRQHIKTIKDIRSFWTNPKFGKIVRILSFQFMRKHSLTYVFNSRLKNRTAYIKYRNKLIDGLKYPQLFTNMKDY